MKKSNHLMLLCLPALLMSAGLANAATKSARAVEACAAEIETYLEEKRTADLSLTLDQSKINDREPLSARTVFELDAYDSTTDSVIGRFTCTVNRRAQVTQLVPLPLTDPDAAIRGRG